MPSTLSSTPGGQRLMSLDVFRGVTIAAMMLVNNPGSWSHVYAPLRHAEWHGWTFTDTVFPFFLWIVGAVIPLSVSRRVEQGQSRRELFLHALRRAAILFGLGLFLAGLSCVVDGSLGEKGFMAWLRDSFLNLRIPGVLQRIAICYLVTMAIFLTTRLRGQVAWIIGLLFGYWALMQFAPFPADVHGETRWVAGLYEKGHNFSAYMDNLVLNGPVLGTHVWKAARTWDPEGTVSTLPAIATCLFGVLTGHLLRAGQAQAGARTALSARGSGQRELADMAVPAPFDRLLASLHTPAEKTAWMMAGGAGLMWLGLLWDLALPINKSLWTSSYAVFMAGLAMLCLGVCYWLIDVHGWRKWAKPFAIYGMNAITVFVLAGVLGRLLSIKVELAGQSRAIQAHLFGTFFAPLASPEIASLLWALMFMAGLYLVARGMYRRKWLVKF